MKSVFSKCINAALSPLGVRIARIRAAQPSEPHYAMPGCLERLRHAANLGFAPNQIIDAGAFTGGWTEGVANIFPDARFLVVEPNPHTQEEIKSTLAPFGDKVTIEQKAIADQQSTMTFNIWGDPLKATSASLQTHVRGEADNRIEVGVDTIDNLATKYGLSPQLIKLDLQGAELKALLGCQNTLKTTEMFIVEFGCLQAYVDRTTPRQLMDIFYDNNYCLYDIVDCHYRPYDKALTGGDFFFVKQDSLLKEHVNYA